MHPRQCTRPARTSKRWQRDRIEQSATIVVPLLVLRATDRTIPAFAQRRLDPEDSTAAETPSSRDPPPSMTLFSLAQWGTRRQHHPSSSSSPEISSGRVSCTRPTKDSTLETERTNRTARGGMPIVPRTLPGHNVVDTLGRLREGKKKSSHRTA